MTDPRTKLSEQVAAEVRRYFKELVFTTEVPRSVRLAEAPSYGQPVLAYAPSSRGADAYLRLAREMLERMGLPVDTVEERVPVGHHVGRGPASGQIAVGGDPGDRAGGPLVGKIQVGP